ncbi:VIT domain-containing protein [Psychromonas sp. MME2]|uniref:VIT domain-containing protein n=1 Tax=Psychromonas sp. MME2 TaxID=3231033 RepID=UPI00339C5CEA
MSLLQQVFAIKLIRKHFWLMVIFMHAVSHTPLFAEQLPVEKDPVGLVYINNSGEKISAPLLSSAVDMDVTGLISRVTVKQVFVNSSDDWINGTYLFPLPENAAVDHLRMIIGERVILGEIKEKEVAQREYQKAQVAGKKASLVTQKRNDMFTTNVANIAPHEKITIEIEYQQRISYQSGVFSLYFPMTITPRYAPAMTALTSEQRQQYLQNLANGSNAGEAANEWQQRWDDLLAQMESLQLAEQTTDHIRSNEDPRLLMTIKVNLHSPLAITSIKSLSHQINTQKNAPNEAIVSLANTKVIANQDFVLTWQVQQTEQAESHLFIENKLVSNEQYGLLMLMPPASSSPNRLVLAKRLSL